MSGGFLALQAKKSKEKKKTADLEDAFRAADTDKDGKLNLDEWHDVLAKTGHNLSRYETLFRVILCKIRAKLVKNMKSQYEINLKWVIQFLISGGIKS